MTSSVVIRLRDGLSLVQFLSTPMPRLAAEMPRIEVVQMRDEVTVEHFPLKGWDDVVAALRGRCRMRVIACGQAELLPYQCGALGLSPNRFHDLVTGMGSTCWPLGMARLRKDCRLFPPVNLSFVHEFMSERKCKMKRLGHNNYHDSDEHFHVGTRASFTATLASPYDAAMTGCGEARL